MKDLIGVFRPLRWYRNSFMLLGAILALGFLKIAPSTEEFIRIFVSFIAICLVASGNYGINEVCDAPFDKHHPQKKHRAIPSGKVKPITVIAISIVLYLLGIVITLPLNNIVLTLSVLLLLLSGLAYNLKPFRLKDLPYLDFMSEALNNPIRLLVGWYAVAGASQLVPSSFLLTYWFLGIFLMSAKRFGEIRFIKDKEMMSNYRKSLAYYSQKKLLFVMIASINASSFMLGALAMKYSLDLLIFLPFLIIWIIWFFNLSYEQNSIVKDPERVFENIPFVVFTIITFGLFLVLALSRTVILGGFF